MTNNVIAFTSQQVSRTAMPPSMLRDNIVSMDDWKKRARPRRTLNGVFFVTDTLLSTGDAA